MALCVVGALFLAYLAMTTSSDYWLYLIAASLLGVAMGIIKNLPDKPR